MLTALLGGQSLSASDLAWHAGVTPQTASGHLARMATAQLVTVQALGRHRYFKLASPKVAQMLETIYQVAGDQPVPRRRLPSYVDTAMREARTCYDHLAGELGVAVAEALVAAATSCSTTRPASSPESGGGSSAGSASISKTSHRQRRCFCRICIDLTERRPAYRGCSRCRLLQALLRLSAGSRGSKDSRAVAVTAQGFRQFAGHLRDRRFRPTKPRRQRRTAVRCDTKVNASLSRAVL